MRLINTDGMAFIGPGSEWFWTAISGVVLAVTFIDRLRTAEELRGFVIRPSSEAGIHPQTATTVDA